MRLQEETPGESLPWKGCWGRTSVFVSTTVISERTLVDRRKRLLLTLLLDQGHGSRQARIGVIEVGRRSRNRNCIPTTREPFHPGSILSAPMVMAGGMHGRPVSTRVFSDAFILRTFNDVALSRPLSSS